MLRLYDYLRSGNGYKARLLLHQLQLPFELVLVDIEKGESRTPEFLRRNPNGRIPVLELDDGTCLAESNAIQWYLAEGTPLLPDTRLARAQVLQWLFFEQYSHEPYIAVVRHWLHTGLTPERERQLPEKRERGEAALRVMERQLATRAFFVGERYSIADIALYAYTHVAHEGGFDLAALPGAASPGSSACAPSRATCRSRAVSAHSLAPCRPAPAAKRAAPSRVSPEAITSRPRRDSCAQGGLESRDPTARRRSADRCAGSAAGAARARGRARSASASARPFGTRRFARPSARASSPLDAAAGEDQIEGVAVADQAREAERAAVDERHAPAPAVDAEDRVLRRHAQVAPQRELETARDGVPLDGGDHGLAEQQARRPHRAVAGLLDAIAAPLGDRAQVGPRAEAAARAREHGDAERRDRRRSGGRPRTARRRSARRRRCARPGDRASRSRRARRVSLRTPLMRALSSRSRAQRARPRACA